MHITGMTIRKGSHPAFADSPDIELKLNQRVNLFIGSNASGKTSLLRVLAEAGLLDNATMIPFNPPAISISEDWNRRFENPTDADAMYLENFMAEDGRLLVVPWVYLPATRITLPGEFDDGSLLLHDDALGDSEVIEDILHISWPDNSQVFNNQWVETIVKKLFDHLKVGKPGFGQFLHMLRLAYRCAKDISKEVIAGSPTNYVSNPSDIFYPPDEIDPLAVEPYLHPGMGVSTIGSQNGGVILQYAGNLSSGTQGTYLWVLYIALKIACHYRFEKDWEKKPAILLIDEIENHLHPTWQRRVIPALLEHFPGLQIFATTHSPFVVAGLEAGQVHLLKRDAKGVVTATTNERDVIGWTADEILRTMMGVDEPTDQVTVDRANRLRQLREKETLTSEEESELNTLRRQVNADLLAKGGLLEIERERYADLVREFLRSQQSELTQDGG